MKMLITSNIRPAVVLLIVMTAVTGLAYPLVVTGIAQAVFAEQANGSLIRKDGAVIGSSLIGQTFDNPKYFWSRPSATSPAYNGGASSGSNLGPTSDVLQQAVRDRVDALKRADPGNALPVPVDLVTASGSGLDPHISPAAAQYQASRVARARGLSVETVRRWVDRFTDGRTFGVLGEPRVNVVLLNLALDQAR